MVGAGLSLRLRQRPLLQRAQSSRGCEQMHVGDTDSSKLWQMQKRKNKRNTEMVEWGLTSSVEC